MDDFIKDLKVEEILGIKRTEGRRECYVPNDGVYPLCIGRQTPEEIELFNCRKCAYYEDMEEPF